MVNRITVDAPAITGSPAGGLLSVANLVPNPDALAVFHGVRYESVLCGHSRRYVEGTDKVFDQLGAIEGAPFTVYRGIETALLTQKDLAGPEITRAFNASAGFGVEEGVQELLNAEAVDITPVAGTPVTNVRAAVGLLEQYAAERYSGVPILHGNKFATGLIPELATEGGKLFTPNGTPVSSGGGYGTAGPGALVADAGEAWLYISGQVNIWQGEVSTGLEASDLKSNRHYALAEATYVATVECFVAAILVGM
jgi:hypothetical protein